MNPGGGRGPSRVIRLTENNNGKRRLVYVEDGQTVGIHLDVGGTYVKLGCNWVTWDAFDHIVEEVRKRR